MWTIKCEQLYFRSKVIFYLGLLITPKCGTILDGPRKDKYFVPVKIKIQNLGDYFYF